TACHLGTQSTHHSLKLDRSKSPERIRRNCDPIDLENLLAERPRAEPETHSARPPPRDTARPPRTVRAATSPNTGRRNRDTPLRCPTMSAYDPSAPHSHRPVPWSFPAIYPSPTAIEIGGTQFG